MCEYMSKLRSDELTPASGGCRFFVLPAFTWCGCRARLTFFVSLDEPSSHGNLGWQECFLIFYKSNLMQLTAVQNRRPNTIVCWHRQLKWTTPASCVRGNTKQNFCTRAPSQTCNKVWSLQAPQPNSDRKFEIKVGWKAMHSFEHDMGSDHIKGTSASAGAVQMSNPWDIGLLLYTLILLQVNTWTWMNVPDLSLSSRFSAMLQLVILIWAICQGFWQVLWMGNIVCLWHAPD